MSKTEVDINQINASGTPSSSTFLRGDSFWATPSGGGGSTTPTANTGAEWDSNLNLSGNNFLDAFTTTVTSATTYTMTVAFTGIQVFTGSTAQLVTLPTTSVPIGAQWLIVNSSTAAVTVQSSGANTVAVMAGGTSAVFTALAATPTTAANWNCQYGGVSVASGKSLTVSNSLTFTGTDGTTMTFPGVNGNVVAPPVSPTTITSAAATSSTTQTAMATYQIPANTTSAGSAFKVKAWGTQNATSGKLTWQIGIGTTTVTTQTASVVASCACFVSASGGSYFDGLVTIRTTGSSGTVIGGGASIGGSTATVTASIGTVEQIVGVSTQTATIAINTTVANFITLSVAASAGTYSAQNAFISVAEA